jgi:hypothetical protein
MHERWCKERYFDTYRSGYTEMRSPWQLNTLTEARLDCILPWGTLGYAYVPADLRKARGRPKYMRAEPILLVAFQDVYSNVYKALTQHRSIMHVEQVEWAMDEPLGVMLPDLHGKAVPVKYKRLPLDTEVLPIKESELAPTHPPAEGGMLDALRA